jgi:hypothetical protein
MRDSVLRRWTVLSLCALCALILGASACGRARDASPGASPSGASGASGAATALGPRFRVVRVETTLGVRSVAQSMDALRALVERHGGYLEHATLSSDGGSRAELSARVPAERLGAFRGELAGAGSVRREQETTTDVTEEHEDRAARLRNLRAAETRLLALLGDRTGALADVLALEQHLAQVREHIEQLEAQQQQLDAQVAFARVDVELVATPGPVAELGLRARFREAGAAGLATARDTALGIALLLLRVGPTLLILGAIGAGALLARRRLLPRRADAAAPPATKATATTAKL